MLKKFLKRSPFLYNLLTPIYKFIRLRRTATNVLPLDSNTYSGLIAYNEYGGYCVPRNSIHRPAAQAILRGEVWERETILYIAEYFCKGDIIHAGTYFGDFLPALSKACGARKIWAFEPNPDNYKSAEITKIINNIENVVLINAALGASAAILPMLTKDPSGTGLGGSSHMLQGGELFDESLIDNIQVIAIDDVIEEGANISLIQLDVEGYEKEALNGALETIKRCKPVLILEILPDLDYMNFLSSLGYSVIGTVCGNTILSCGAPDK